MAPGRGYEIPKTKVNLLKNVDLSSILTPAKPAAHIAGTKVLVTLGPASREIDVLVKLLEAGTTCVRVDLTYGSTEYHRQSLRNLQEAVRKTRRLCAVVLDTFGRELVIRREYEVDEKGWPRPIGCINIKKGQEVVVTTDSGVARDNILPIEFTDFDKMCEEGDTLFVGRYLTNGADVSSVYMDVVKVEEGKVFCHAQNDATLDGLLTVIHSERSTDGMSSSQANLPVLTARDKRAIAEITKDFVIDFVALTYTCSAEDVVELRQYLESLGRDSIKIIAKVESRQALVNFESVAEEADAILLSRGNLGLDVPSEKVAIVQKAAIMRCNLLGKPVMITRVVDTMTSAPRCTRAEATDVANAVLDGVDGIMLGAETLRGKYPVESVVTVLGICRQAEQVYHHKAHFDFLMQQAMQDQDDGPRSGSESPIGESPRYEAAEDESPQASTKRPPRNPNSLATQRSGFSYNRSGSFGNVRNTSSASLAPTAGSGQWGNRDIPLLSRAEAMASTAVRAADKVQAKLIVVYASSGRTASLVAKYRPPMPILTLVVPRLKSDSLGWQMQGRSLARQLLCVRGVIPILSAPSVDGSSDGMLSEAITIAAKRGLVEPHDHVVCLLAVKESLVVKIISVDGLGRGMVSSRKGSHNDLAGLTSGTDQSHFYSKLDGSQAVLAEPNIGVKVPVKTPAIHLQGGQQSETTKDGH